MKFLIFVVFLAFFGISHGNQSYEGSKVFRILVKEKHQLETLVALRTIYENEDGFGVNFWTEPSLTGPTDILITKTSISKILGLLDESGIHYEEFISDVQALLETQLNSVNADAKLSWTVYNRVSVIHEFLDELAQNYSIVSVGSIGNSTEGRDQKYVKVSTSRGIANKAAILIDGTFHAREWISPATNTYMLNKLVTNAENFNDILDYLDIYFLPVANPDGYEYTFASDRLWRKTRSVNNGTTNCRGVDPNRNFEIAFGEEGSSSNPCAETYTGDSAFCIPETRQLADFILENKNELLAYISLHSYSQAWLTPNAYTDALPEDFTAILDVGTKAIEALQSVHGTRYVVGPTSTTLYFHSGASQDWAKEVAGVKYTYTVELRDTGTFGFLLPPSQIIPTGEETWTAVQVVLREMVKEVNINP